MQKKQSGTHLDNYVPATTRCIESIHAVLGDLLWMTLSLAERGLEGINDYYQGVVMNKTTPIKEIREPAFLVEIEGYEKDNGEYNVFYIVDYYKSTTLRVYTDLDESPIIVFSPENHSIYEYPPKTFRAYLFYVLNPSIWEKIHNYATNYLTKEELGAIDDFKYFLSKNTYYIDKRKAQDLVDLEHLEEILNYALAHIGTRGILSKKIEYVRREINHDRDLNKLDYFIIGFRKNNKTLSYAIENNVPEAVADLIQLYSAEKEIEQISRFIDKLWRLSKKIFLYIKANK